jgi:conjugative transfer signal peptidase TraF
MVTVYANGYRINLTSSMLKGVYQIQHDKEIQRGDLVSACLPTKTAKYAYSRGYLSNGSCSNGYVPVIKEILAIPHDSVVMNTNGIKVNGKHYNYKEEQVDHLDRPLNPKEIDKNINGYILIGTNSKNSWDSRYFGEVSRQDIMHVLKQVWIW